VETRSIGDEEKEGRRGMIEGRSKEES